MKDFTMLSAIATLLILAALMALSEEFAAMAVFLSSVWIIFAIYDSKGKKW